MFRGQTEADRTAVKELQIEDLAVGEGPSPSVGQKVRILYTGRLADGTQFADVTDADNPSEFVIGDRRVISGLEQGLLTMKVGGKRRLTIPPRLAFGDSGTPGGLIPPDSTVIIEVELLAMP